MQSKRKKLTTLISMIKEHGEKASLVVSYMERKNEAQNDLKEQGK